jgi:hypothetical protein
MDFAAEFVEEKSQSSLRSSYLIHRNQYVLFFGGRIGLGPRLFERVISHEIGERQDFAHPQKWQKGTVNVGFPSTRRPPKANGPLNHHVTGPRVLIEKIQHS